MEMTAILCFMLITKNHQPWGKRNYLVRVLDSSLTAVHICAYYVTTLLFRDLIYQMFLLVSITFLEFLFLYMLNKKDINQLFLLYLQKDSVFLVEHYHR